MSSRKAKGYGQLLLLLFFLHFLPIQPLCLASDNVNVGSIEQLTTLDQCPAAKPETIYNFNFAFFFLYFLPIQPLCLTPDNANVGSVEQLATLEQCPAA